MINSFTCAYKIGLYLEMTTCQLIIRYFVCFVKILEACAIKSWKLFVTISVAVYNCKH